MPDVSEFTFRQLIHYFYTDQIPFVCVSDCLPLLELANRFCLPRLTHLIEDKVEAELRMMLEKGSDVIMECLMLLEESQVFYFFSSFIVSYLIFVSCEFFLIS